MNIIKRAWRFLDDRSGFTEMIRPLLKHPVPPGTGWAYVFGSATVFCLIIQVVTGIGLAFLYQPSSSAAYPSLQFIMHRAAYGAVLRGIHYFGASGMILMMGVHMIRVYITASYKFPREMSWVSGVFLLFITLAMGFTGQVLGWDAGGISSAVVGAEQMGRVPLIGKSLARLLLGGDTIGGHSLNRFFSFHVFVFPALLFLFVGYHLMQVFRNGISEPPKAGRIVDPRTYRAWYKDLLQKRGIPFWPYVAWRDVVFGTIVIITIVLLAVFVGAPALTQPPDPAIVKSSPTPDWYMTPIFSLFALMPPQIESVVIFVGPLLTVFALLALPFLSNKGERSPLSRPWAVFGTLCVVVFVGSLLLIGGKAPWSPHFKTAPLVQVMRFRDSTLYHGADLFYKKGCEYCHQINGEGGERGPDLTHVAQRLNESQLTIRIVNGSEDMPAYGSVLNHRELETLVNFLKAMK